MAIKRNITDISALKRGANNVTAVYRGNTLIWPTTPPPTPIVVDTFGLLRLIGDYRGINTESVDTFGLIRLL